MRKKGQAMSVSQIFVSLMAIGLITILILLFFTKYFDIEGIVDESSNERQTITLAQVFLSSSQLIHVDEEGVVYRAMMDKQKLDKSLISDVNVLKDYDHLYKKYEENPLFREISYPNSTYILHVEDLDAGDKWIIFGHGNMSGLNHDVGSYVNYLTQIASLDVSPYLGSLKTGVNQKKFPVSIRISDQEIHVGKMTLVSKEL